ncbi:MAG: leucyl aminopeptidase [Gammaproteobacteria bacterium]|nr:MAG: leucyl aminopeptidase [Gammaproteobacteria bacterium]
MTLQFSLSPDSPETSSAPCVVVGLFDDGLSPAAARIDATSGGALKRLIASNDLCGKSGATQLLFGLPGVAAPRVLVVGLGEAKKVDAARFARAHSEAARVLKGLPIASALSFLTELEVPGKDTAWKLRAAVLACDAQAYKYTATLKPKKKSDTPEFSAIAFAGAGADANALTRASAIADGVRFARELGNLPPNICTPVYLAGEAQKIATEHAGVTCEVLDEAAMKQLGMGALLGVAQGAANPPRLIVLQWNGAGDAKPYALVGKGVTFDTGGISIKPSAGMEEMKFDMCGAAGVLGAFLAAVKLKLKLNLVCVVPAVENMPGHNAQRPSDVVTSMSGQTIEVLNTDAEGRLILCDALSYVQKYTPQTIIDAATLTGACVVALGKHATGLFTADDTLAAELTAAGEAALDRAWRLPLWDDYQSQLDTGFADVANIGGKYAGAITAACFLARFTEGQRWAHLDIAGTAWEEGRKGSATGRPVPLLVQYLLDRAG